MINKKCIPYIFLLIIIGIVFGFFIKSSIKPVLTYKEFNNTCTTIFNELGAKYDTVELPPSAIVYDGNPEQAWTKDVFTIISNSADKPKQKECIIINEGSVSKVIMSYAPDISVKNYLQVDRLRERDLAKSDAPEEGVYPIWSMNSFTVDGIFIKVETVGIFETKEAEDNLIMTNGYLTQDVQQIILNLK